MSEDSPIEIDGPALMTIEASTRVAGISRSTFYREKEAGRIGVVHVRSRPYVTKAALEAYIKARTEAGS